MTNEQKQSPGVLLKRTRETRGMSKKQAATQLNLLVAQIDALEADRWDILPGAAFARGYVRSYAKLLGMDDDTMLLALAPDLPNQPNQPLPDTGSGYASPNASSPLEASHAFWLREKQHLKTGGLALAVVFLGFWLFRGGDASELPGAPALPTEVEVDTVSGVPYFESINLDSIGDAIAEELGNGSSDSLKGQVPPMGLRRAELEAEAQAASAAADTVTTTVPFELFDRLSFNFAADCWVEVRDAKQRILYSDIRKAGQELELKGAAPFSVTLGYAPGVSISFNGQPVTVTPQNRSQSARLVVDNS